MRLVFAGLLSLLLLPSQLTASTEVSLSSWQNSHYQTPIVLATVNARVSGSRRGNYLTSRNFNPTDGEVTIASNLDIGRLDWYLYKGAGRLQLRKHSSSRGRFSHHWNRDDNLKLVIMVVHNGAIKTVTFSPMATSGSWSNWGIDNADNVGVMNSISSGDKLLIGIAEPAPEEVEPEPEPPPPTEVSIDLWNNSLYTTPLVLATFQANLSNSRRGKWLTSRNFTPTNGEVDISSRLGIGRLDWYLYRGSGRLQLRNRSGNRDRFSSHWNRGDDVKLVIMAVHEGVVKTVTFSPMATKGHWSNWGIDNDDDAAVMNAISTGDTVLIGITRPVGSEDLNQQKPVANKGSPGAPYLFTAAVNQSGSQARFTWETPTILGATPITGYKIEVGPDGVGWRTLVRDTGSTATSYTHDGDFTQNPYYYLRVSAINGAGAGLPSQHAIIVGVLQGTPGSPRNLRATMDLENQLARLTWEVPSNRGDYPITGHWVEISTDNWKTILFRYSAGSQTSYTFRPNLGFDSQATYSLRVSAANRAGTGRASNEIEIGVSRRPGAPTDLSAIINLGGTSAALTWTAPSDSGATAVTGYKIEFKDGTNAWSTLSANTGSTTTSYTHTRSFTTGTTYRYRVSAINSVGIGFITSITAIRESKPSAPRSLNTLINLAGNSASLNWRVPNDEGSSDITGYKIQFKSGSNAWTTLVSDTASVVTSYTHTATFTTGTTYKYRVSAINSVGTGDHVEATAVRESVPDAPTNLNATINLAGNSAGLTWRAPSDGGSSSITGYKIQFKSGSNAWTTISNSTSSTSYTHNRTFATGTTYKYRVSAINSVGTGSHVEATAVRESKPDAPTNLVANINAAGSSASLTWTAPSDEGSSSVSGYKVEFKNGSNAWTTISTHTNSRSTIYTHITTFITGTTYKYRVSASTR